MRPILRASGLMLGSAAALVLAAYLLLLIVNREDQPPSALVTRIQAEHLANAAVPDGRNAYVYMLGFSAGPDENPRELGVRSVAWGRSRANDPMADLAADPPAGRFHPERTRSSEVSALAGSCTNDSAGCLLNSDAHRRAREAWLASEHWLLDRYRELLALPFWSEPLPYDIRMPLPSFRPAMDGQKLLFVEALELAENGEAMRVNELLTADLRFWRRSLASSNYLISKMVALASIRRHFLYGNAVLRALPAGIASDAIPREWGVPARPEERSLVRCFGAEALFSINSTPWYLAQTPDTWLDIDGTLVKRVVVAAWPLLGPLVQPMDLGNRRAGRLHELARSLDVPYEGLRSAIERIGSASLRPEADRGIAMYNIAGIGLLERNVSYAGYADYGARTADFEGMRRATLLLATLRARSVPYGGRAGFVRGSELRDPYTNQPFEWIEASQTLVFEGLAQAQRGRFALAL